MGSRKWKKHDRKNWVYRYSREKERAFFFYATIILFLVYVISVFIGN